MKIIIILIAIASVFGMAFGAIIGTKINSNRKAERQVCMEIVEDVIAGNVTRTAYMGTRCPAWLLIEGNDNVPHD